jgi:hypothetical protein
VSLVPYSHSARLIIGYRDNGMFFGYIRDFLREWVPVFVESGENDGNVDLVDFRSANTAYVSDDR